MLTQTNEKMCWGVLLGNLGQTKELWYHEETLITIYLTEFYSITKF